MSSLKTRFISAAIGLLLIFLLNYFFAAMGLYTLCSLVFLIMAYECGTISFNHKNRFLFLIPIHALFFIFFYFRPSIEFLIPVVLFDIISWTWVHRAHKLPSKDLYLNHGKLYEFIFYSLIAPTYILAHLVAVPNYKSLFFLFFLVASFDTLSYFWGKTLGGKIFKVKLYPTSSPSKTIEGALFAAMTCIPLTLVLDQYYKKSSFLIGYDSIFVKAGLILLVLFAALTGDLTESIMKRNANIKDSGTLLPGHGGFFDRLDGLLFASIISYMLIQS